MARSAELRNCFLDAVPGEVLSQHRRSLEENAFFYPELVCARDDPAFFLKLRDELDFRPAWLDNGMPFSRHICLGSDSLLASSPVFRQIIELLVRTFQVEPVRSLVNLYRNGGDWCNLHSDQYDAGHCDINFTIGASFGEERSLLFEEKGHDRRGAARGAADGQRSQISIAQRNGDVHAFSELVNERWRHGVPKCPRAQGERISIMLWCYRGDGAAFSDTAVRLSGSFPHLLHYDPKSSREPRACEACKQTKLQYGGKVDLDHRWCCAECWEEHNAMGRLPRPAQDPQHVTDCLTIHGSQLAVAVLAGMKTVECRKSELSEGWYALHVARRPIDPFEKRRVEEQWPTAPSEDELPHEAIVGLVLISKPDGKRPTEDCPWAAPGICYVICAVVALERTLPARPPGNLTEPWRLSPAAQRSVASLIEGQPIYENVAPKLAPAAKANAGTSGASNGKASSGNSDIRVHSQQEQIDKAERPAEAGGGAADGQDCSWWHASTWGGGEGVGWQGWSAASWAATAWQTADENNKSNNWSSQWGAADSGWYYSQSAGEEPWRSERGWDSIGGSTEGHHDTSTTLEPATAASSVGEGPLSDAWHSSTSAKAPVATSTGRKSLSIKEDSDSRTHTADSKSGVHDADTRRRSHDLDDDDSRPQTSESRRRRSHDLDEADSKPRASDSRRRNRDSDDVDSGTRAAGSRSGTHDADARRRNHDLDDADSRPRGTDSRRNNTSDNVDSRMLTAGSRSGNQYADPRRNHNLDDADSGIRTADSRGGTRDADSRRRKNRDTDDVDSRARIADSRNGARAVDSKTGTGVELPPGLEERHSQAGPRSTPSPGSVSDSRAPTARRASDPRSAPPPYAPPALQPPPYAPPALERPAAGQSAGSRPGGQNSSTEAKTAQARTGRSGPRGGAVMQEASATPPRVSGERSTTPANTDPWGGTGDPWTMALEQGRAPSKKPTASPANAAWKRYRT